MAGNGSESPRQDLSRGAQLGVIVPPRSRPMARQACDACRGRRTKCEMPIANQDTSSSVFHYDQRPSTRDVVRQCERCARLQLSCTFLLPTGVRGPRRKKPSATTGDFGTVSNERYNVAAPCLPSPSEASEMYQEDSASHVRRSMSSRGSGIQLSPLAQRVWPDSSSRSTDICSPPLPLGTDALCPRPLLNQILADYLDFLYPLIPVVHRPSFRTDLSKCKDVYDNDFLVLIICLSAATVATMPSLFRKYQSSTTPTRFQTRTEMVNCCYKIAMDLRGPEYFDELNIQKWAASYLLSIASFQVGQVNRSRMLEVEYAQLARCLEIHRASSYHGLSCIEAQLRKKAFWLNFYGYVHGKLQNLRRERLAYLDEQLLSTIDLGDLMPSDVDDEDVFEHEILPRDSPQISLTAGFNLHSVVFWTAYRSPKMITHSSGRQDHCACVRALRKELQLEHLRSRLEDLKYMLDIVPAPLRPWAVTRNSHFSKEEGEESGILNSQFASMRANIHITHLWLQSTILDHIDSLLQSDHHRSSLGSVPAYDPKASWPEREDICRQLLHVLHNIPEVNLESNGHHLTFKIRDVAVTLLNCPFETQEEVARRAHQYLLEFTNILSRLDGSEIVATTSLKSWVDIAKAPLDD